jgi:SAM-dependent methyltransferase
MMKDYLWLNLRDLPYFRALLRAVEARVYQDFDLPSPILDLGCGDGHFITTAFDDPLDVGIDPWTGPLKKAAIRGSHSLVVQGGGAAMPFSDGYFASGISNSVLEHIPDLDAVLEEAARVLRPGAPFLFCVPNHQFLSNLSISTTLDRVGLNGLGDRYRSFFNRISRHVNCDPPEIWAERMNRHGFVIDRWWHYFSPQALHTLEWGHYFGLPSWILHALTRRWILVQTSWNLVLTRKIVQPYYDELSEQEMGAYTFYIARRKAP